MSYDTVTATDAALETLLWSSPLLDDSDDEYADARYDVLDFPADARRRMADAVVTAYSELPQHVRDYVTATVTPEQFGADLVLTANRHAAGFWYRGHPQEFADALTAAAHNYSFEFYVTAGGEPDFA